MKKTVSVKRSYRDGCVSLRVAVGVSGYNGDDVNLIACVSISTDQARELAKELVEKADREDGRMKERESAKARREQWRKREIAAGRMKVL